ncbi:MAG: hypothetical protein B6242_17045 [Anaerolineaceae bacterium 4572_78]|nr:MAG: hypothetical protein B6242_17045 [Anaerolineaceae bacterium 4572_78]
MATQYNISPDEKMTAVMAYTRDGMYWGNLVTPKDMKVSGLLQRSQMLPEYLVFREANSLILSSRNPQPIENPEFFIPIDSIIAFHVMPSVREESAYYDANQHNL